MKAPENGVIRCPKDCPERKPGCHNVDTCELWAKQQEQRQKGRDARWNVKQSYPQSWSQRGILDKEGRIKK